VFIQINEQGIQETNNFVGYPHRYNSINVLGKTYPISTEHKKKIKEASLKVDHVTKLYCDKPSPSEILEMFNNRYKGVTYQRKGNETSKVSHENSKVVSSPKDDLSIDLGNWIQNAKVLVQVAELIKIPSQKDKLIKAIEGPKEQIVERTNERMVRVPRETNEDVPKVLHSIDWTKEDHPPFFVSRYVILIPKLSKYYVFQILIYNSIIY